MKKMSANELKAYKIGIEEASNSRRIIPACKSQKMNDFMKEIKNGLLPIIGAYNAGVAYEITHQTMVEM